MQIIVPCNPIIHEEYTPADGYNGPLDTALAKPCQRCMHETFLDHIRSFRRNQTGARLERSSTFALYHLCTIRRLNRALGFVFVSGIVIAACRRYNPLATLPLNSPATMSTTAALKHLKVAPKEAHKATVIFLHVGHFHQYRVL
jgi:hypothetical protein